MLKNTLFIKTVCGVTIYSFALALMPHNAKAWGLPPESFNRMYTLAHNGEVEGLRASVHRGLNIDAVNSRGDTGLCVAVRRHDIRAYNSFRASGANPYHPCTQNLENYNEFVQNSRAVPLRASSREAYSALGKEQYRVSPWVWWTGGLLLAGGVAAIALSGGGGGGGGSSHTPAVTPSEAYKSLGSLAATKGSVKNAAVQTEKTNNSYIEYAVNKNTSKIASINLNKDVLQNTAYIDILFKSKTGGEYTNSNIGKIYTTDGSIAMDAAKRSIVTNNGYINIKADNAALGMVASESSTAVNNGKNTNGIVMYYSGTSDNSIIGMYADTNSTITNNGKIYGTATLGSTSETTALDGSMIGMEAMTINSGQNRNEELVTVTNGENGTITLSAGDGIAEGETVKIELVGMGNYLNYGFLYESKDINRAEKVSLTNNGDIALNYVGNYDSDALRKGKGGIVGMRAEVNAIATNNKNITIGFSESSDNNKNATAGMLLVHGGMANEEGEQIGGILKNKGNISILTTGSNSPINYGMLSVEGDGSVSNLYRVNPLLTNEQTGTILIKASNSYGMATYNGGTLTNNGTITLGDEDTATSSFYANNVAMYAAGDISVPASILNYGTININSNNSVALKNEHIGSTRLVNNGTINVNKDAVNTKVFGGAYSTIVNEGDITYKARPTNADGDDYQSTVPSSDDTVNAFENYNPQIGIAVMNTKPETEQSSSQTENAINANGATITIDAASFVSGIQVDRSQGQGINNGTISILRNTTFDNTTDSIGMFLAQDTLDNARLLNNSIINVDAVYSSGMASVSTGNAGMRNESGAIITSTHDYTIGMYVGGRTKAQNGGTIAMKYAPDATEANYMTAVYIGDDADSGKSTFSNDESGVINVGEQNKEIAYGYGIFSDSGSSANITNNGIINIYTKTQGGGIWLLGAAQAENKNVINLYSNNTKGMYAKAAAASGDDETSTPTAKLTNSENAIINVGAAASDSAEEIKVKDSYGIYADGNIAVDNKGTINLYNDESSINRSYAIYAVNGANVNNTGIINLMHGNSAAIYTDSGTLVNEANLNIASDNSYGLEVSGSSDATNNGEITIGSAAHPVSQSYGLVATNEASGTITNKANIDVYSTGDSYGVYLRGSANLDNSANITAHKTGSGTTTNAVTAVMAGGDGTIDNSGTIKAVGDNSFAVKGTGTTLNLNNGAEDNKNANIILSAEGENLSGGAAVSTSVAGDINNYGTITVYNNNAAAIKASSGDNIINKGNIIINGSNGIGINSGETANITSNGKIELTQGGTAIKADSGTKIATDSEAEIILGGTGGTGIDGGMVTNVANGANITIADGDNNRGINFGGSGKITNSGVIVMGTQQGTATGNYGIFATSGSVENSGTVTMNATGSAIRANSGVAVTNTSTGVINIEKNNSYGIYSGGGNTTITNEGTINLNASSATNKSYGIYVNDAANNQVTVTNSGTINATTDSAVGIYAVSPKNITNTNDGVINVSGTNAIGIHVIVNKSSDNVTIANNGTINVGSGASYAILVHKNYLQGTETKQEDEQEITVYSADNTTVSNQGTDITTTTGNIRLEQQNASNWCTPGNEVGNCGTAALSMAHPLMMMAKNTAASVRLVNNGIIQTEGDVDFGDGSAENGQNVLAAGGQYVADSFSGTVHVDSSNVAQGFEQSYVNEDAFVGEDNGIEVVSDSYMFEASTEQNDNGNTNVVMNLRPFTHMVNNNTTASFLATNYTAQQGANVFQVLRNAPTAAQFNLALNRGLGFSIMPNFVKQNQDMERTLNTAINDDIIKPSNEDKRSKFKMLYFNNKEKSNHDLSGYKDHITSVYGFNDFALNDLYSRAGLGIAIARMESKFDDDSTRYNNFAEIFAPFTYYRGDSVIMLKPKGGYAHGHYRRLGADKKYKANNEEYYYGADTGLWHTFDFGAFELTPNIGLNVSGMYVKGVDESNGGLKIKGKNVVSTQSALGLDAAKEFALADEQSLRFSLGGKYYHEFGDKYRTKATVDDMVGYYDITDERFERNFGLMSLKAAYQYGKLTLGAEAHAPLEQNRKPYYLLNMGYQF